MSQDPTPNQNQLSRKYLVYKVLTNLFFVSAVWLYFYRLFVTDQQIGIFDGLAFAIGLVAEVPSGALADRFGRDKLVKIGQFLAGSGILIQAFGNSFAPFLIGQSIMMIGVSFASGADEALFFEKLNFDRNSVNWRKLITRGSQVILVGSLFATIAGGSLHLINPRIPWILTGLSFIGSVAIIWTMKDDRPRIAKRRLDDELREHLRSIKSGFAEFLTPKLWLYVPIILIIQGLFYTAGWGILRLILLDRFHFEPFAGSLVIASSSLMTIGILTIMNRHADKMSEKRVIVLISLLAACSLLLSIADIGVWGYFVIFALYAGEHTLYPFISETLNNRTDGKQRATALSVASFLRTLPYVALAPIVGYLNTRNKLEYFLIAWSILIFLAILMYVWLKKKDSLIDITKKKTGS